MTLTTFILTLLPTTPWLIPASGWVTCCFLYVFSSPGSGPLPGFLFMPGIPFPHLWLSKTYLSCNGLVNTASAQRSSWISFFRVIHSSCPSSAVLGTWCMCLISWTTCKQGLNLLSLGSWESLAQGAQTQKRRWVKCPARVYLLLPHFDTAYLIACMWRKRHL